MLSLYRTSVRLVVLIGVVAAEFAGMHRADAQGNLIPSVRLKAGIFLPEDTSLQDAIGNTWFKIGADVSVPFSLVPLGSARVGIDYAVNGSSSVVPVTLTQVFRPSLGLQSPLYLGAGIGLWTAHISGLSTATRIGARLLGGYYFTSRFFLELQYDFVDTIDGVHVDGLSVLVGTKF